MKKKQKTNSYIKCHTLCNPGFKGLKSYRPYHYNNTIPKIVFLQVGAIILVENKYFKRTTILQAVNSTKEERTYLIATLFSGIAITFCLA